MFNRRLLNRKHKNENQNNLITKNNDKSEFEVKFSEEKDLFDTNEKNKIININNKSNINQDKNFEKEIINMANIDKNSKTDNFLNDNFYSEKQEDKNNSNIKELNSIFSPITQEQIQKNNIKKNNYEKPKILKNNDEIKFNININENYSDKESDNSEFEKPRPKNYKAEKLKKIMDDIVDSSDENNLTNLIVKDKVAKIKEIKEHQRKCLLQENLDGLYGKSQNPNEIIKGIYNTIEGDENDSELEEEINNWEKAQFKSGVKLGGLNMDKQFGNKEIFINNKNNKLYEKINKGNYLDFDELMNDVYQGVDKNKNLMNNFENKKNEYNSEIEKINEIELKLKDSLNFYINQYYDVKKKLINIMQGRNDNENKESNIEEFYLSD